MVTLTANDDEDIAVIDPIGVTLSAEGDALPTPVGMTTVTVINNDYVLGFERRTITLEEGMSTNMRLIVDPALLSANKVTVSLMPSDNEQIAADPQRLVFSKADANKAITVSAKEDNIAEPERTFTVKMIFETDTDPTFNPAFINAELSVIVPADEISARVLAERAVIPEGEAASVLIDAFTFHDLNVTMALSEAGDRTGISLSGSSPSSSSSLTLNANNPSGAFNIFIEDNGEPQANSRTFVVDLSSAPALRPDLPSSMTFTIPPNDLTAYASTRVDLTLEEAERTMTVDIRPPLQGGKSFIVFSEDPRIAVKAGLIAPDRSPFPVELALNALPGREERLRLSISHVDVWRQRSAQAQLSAGGEHSCAIREDGAAVCWGLNESGQADPLSAAGVNANTRFLSLSAGDFHTCGIKADNTAACWGFDGGGQASPRGADADARFLSLSAGHLHTCGIRADNTAACWGDNGNGQSDPTSAAGVNANAKFLALTAGAFHTCGIRADSSAVCWGFDGNGQASPRGADADARFLSLSAGSFHTCGIRADSTAACWGHNGSGEASPTSGAQSVAADARFIALSAGGDLRGGHSCGIKADNTAACWGADGNGQSNPTNGFQGVDANTVFLALSAGAEHSCGIRADGAAACWGGDRRGQASPPPGGLSRAPDVIMLAERATILRTQGARRRPFASSAALRSSIPGCG